MLYSRSLQCTHFVKLNSNSQFPILPHPSPSLATTILLTVSKGLTILETLCM